MKSYRLRIYEPLPTAPGFSTNPATAQPAFLADITDEIGEGFGRVIGEEGDLDGTIVIQGRGERADAMMAWFDAWIGCHVEETFGGVTYEGLIYMMEFIRYGYRDRRHIFGVSEDADLWNAVKVRYEAPSISQSPQLTANGGFEGVGNGSPDIFVDWAEYANSGTITRNTSIKVSGAASCQLTKGVSANTEVAQFYPTDGGDYQLSFYTRGDGTNAGRYRIANQTDGTAIVATTSTGVSGTIFALVEVDFTVPADCETFAIYLMAPSATGGDAYFDDVTLREYQDTILETDWFTNDESIKRFSRREIIKSVGKTNSSNADKEAERYLSRRAWPIAVPVSSVPEQSENTAATLIIRVIGYIATVNYRYVTGLSGKRLDLIISDIVNQFCDFLVSGRLGKGRGISSLADLLSQDEVPEGRALNVIRALTSKGTGNDLPMIFSILRRVASYVQFEPDPVYYRRKGKLSNTAGGSVEVSPRQVRPGVVRRMDYPVGGQEDSSVLQDRRDMYVSAVEVRPDGTLHFKNISSLSESAITVWEDKTIAERPLIPQPIGTDGGQDFTNTNGEFATVNRIVQEIVEDLQQAGWRRPDGQNNSSIGPPGIPPRIPSVPINTR